MTPRPCGRYKRRGSLISIDANQPREDVTLALEVLLARSLKTLGYPAKSPDNPQPRSHSYALDGTRDVPRRKLRAHTVAHAHDLFAARSETESHHFAHAIMLPEVVATLSRPRSFSITAEANPSWSRAAGPR